LPSDHSAALEILRRGELSDIMLYMSKEKVKQVLLSKFCTQIQSPEFVRSLSNPCWAQIQTVFNTMTHNNSK
jgi:hypothetical protein